MEENTVISVVVLTYNSAETVEETLESIFRQTYTGPLELIITDDCSSDSTVAICSEWAESHRSRFCRIKIICSRTNTGVSANINRGCREAAGEWVKPIAADDILAEDCLSTMKREADSKGSEFLSSAIRVFGCSEELRSPDSLPVWNPAGDITEMDLAWADSNFDFWVPAPSFFISRRLLENVGYYPEIIRNIEDAPMLRKVLGRGYRIHSTPEPTVFYRYGMHQQLSTSVNMLDHRDMYLRLHRTYLYPFLPIHRKIMSDLRFLSKRMRILYTRLIGKKCIFAEFNMSKA